MVDNIVWKILKSGEIVPFIHTNEKSSFGICLSKKAEIVVCFKTSVATYSPDGRTKIQEITNKNDKGETIFDWAYIVVQNNNLDYYMLDWENLNVLAFDSTFSFGGH